MNRSEIQQNLVDCIVDGMDMEMLCQLACDALSTTYDGYSDSELMEEVKEYYPHLLEEDLDKKDDSWYTDPMSKASHHHY